MQGCLVAIVFSVGSVLLLGGLVSYGGNLFGASVRRSGLVLCCSFWPQSRRNELTTDGDQARRIAANIAKLPELLVSKHLYDPPRNGGAHASAHLVWATLFVPDCRLPTNSMFTRRQCRLCSRECPKVERPVLVTARRFPPPWCVEVTSNSFVLHHP